MRKKVLIIMICLCILLLFGGIAIRIVEAQDYLNNDFFTFWLAGKFALEGVDPYNGGDWVAWQQMYGLTWIPNEHLVYPLPVSLLFLPLALLPYKIAYIVWVTIGQVALLLTLLIVLWVSNYRLKPIRLHLPYLIPMLLGCTLFRPVFLALRNGQLETFLLLILAVVAYCWKQEKWLLGGILLMVITLKPQIGIPIAGLLGLWALFTKRWRILVGMASGGILLVFLGFILNPAWIQEYLSIGNNKLAQNFGIAPTIWGACAYLCGYQQDCAFWSGAIASILLVFTGFFLVWRFCAFFQEPYKVISLCIVVGLLVTPYILSYSQVLLVLPLASIVYIMRSESIPYLVSSTLFIFMALLGWGLLLIAVQLGTDIWSVGLTFAVLVVMVGLAILLKKRQAAALTHPIEC